MVSKSTAMSPLASVPAMAYAAATLKLCSQFPLRYTDKDALYALGSGLPIEMQQQCMHAEVTRM